MGLGSIFKGFGKLFKKIGKGIKKVVKKVGKVVGKLGIIGQVGMMVLMPHMGSMIWKGLLKIAPGVGLAGTKFGMAGLKTLGTALTAPGVNPIQWTIGKVVQGIHAGATATGKVWNSITGLLNGGADKLPETMQGKFTFEKNWGQGTFQDSFLKSTENLDLVGAKFGTEASARALVPQSGYSPDFIGGLMEEPTSGIGGAAQNIFGDPKRTTVPIKTEEDTPSLLSPSGIFEAISKGATRGVEDFTRNLISTAGQDEDGRGYSALAPQIISDSPTVAHNNDLTLQNQGYYYGGNAYQNSLASIYGNMTFS